MKFSAAIVVTFLSLLLGVSAGSSQETYPNRPIKIVVPNPPGGVTDLIGRVFGQKLTEAWGQSVIVENRPGGDEMIAGEVVARSAPDGYTLLVASNGGVTSSPQLHKDKSYDPIKDLTPILYLGDLAPVLLVTSSLPATNVEEFIALVKSKPGQLNYGSFGNGSYPHVAMEDLKRRTGIDITHIAYRGAPPAYTALLSGEIAVMITNLAGAETQAATGKAKIIAAAGATRSTFRPDLPTIGETVPGFATGAWWGIFGPANLPKPIIEKIRAEWARTVNTPEMKKIFETNTLQPVEMTQEKMVQFIDKDQTYWAQQFKQAGLEAQ